MNDGPIEGDGLRTVNDCQTHGTPSSFQIDFNVNADSPFTARLKHIISSQYSVYQPGWVNYLRAFEVCMLGMLTGALFPPPEIPEKGFQDSVAALKVGYPSILSTCSGCGVVVLGIE